MIDVQMNFSAIEGTFYALTHWAKPLQAHIPI